MARSPSARGQASRNIINPQSVRRGSPLEFFRETISELRKAVWPTREETARLTVYVIILSTFIGAILAGLDYGFSQTFSRLILG